MATPDRYEGRKMTRLRAVSVNAAAVALPGGAASHAAAWTVGPISSRVPMAAAVQEYAGRPRGSGTRSTSRRGNPLLQYCPTCPATELPPMRHVTALLLVSALAASAPAWPADAQPGKTDTHTASQVAPLPAPPAWLDALDRLYDAQLRVPGLEDRRFKPEQWWQIVHRLVDDARGFRREEVGRSAEGRPLQHVSWGDGEARVLLWSQMHGDESTASMALADLFRFLGEHPDHPLVQRLRQGTTLHVLPIVNPDGAARFQRRNAQGIDINRDARALASPEARVLHALRERIQPDFGFNLHDQQVGYRAGDSARGTAIALLAPAFNEAREIDTARGRAIEVAVAIRAVLEPYVGGH